ncbi:hypothetical protein LY01_02849 [Nonlabens xylanidelens]|uniref:Uncharacterized protein n=1 Tax=Nonlabens xylanidelens TaxID=191564 RepID=A0A2S6IEW4_9FLAO|nr:hypothetical protein [Nonlabens xylanidelens]PPK92764.1 hypothetical protein LY01_02849 [Nonlabens xylanidelens]PQJ19810.1 hypothetical protein BST94_06085 [Nonlabens xylanidelens]
MSYAEELNVVPISDSTPEYHFGRIMPVNMWVEFQKSDHSIWRGSFECGESEVRSILEQDEGKVVIIAGGIGYVIDNDSNSLKSKINLDNVIFISKINNQECLLVDWSAFYILNMNYELIEIKNLNSIYGVSAVFEDDQKIVGAFESSIYQGETRYFEFDKIKKYIEIKKTAKNDNSIWKKIKSKFNF